MPKDETRHAELYRMVMPKHLCPWGLKTKDLLEREGFVVDDHPLRSKEETEAFQRARDVKTTPQVFIGGTRIGGYEDVRRHFGKPVRDPEATSYRPVVAIFAVAFLMALGLSWLVLGTVVSWQVLAWFIAFGMVLLGLQKLQDIESFQTMFLNYDLLAQRQVRYGYVYPFAETGAGLLMLAGVLTWLAAPVALVIGTIGAVSVIKAVYLDKRELKCACVGGGSNVPLGFVSLTENLAMIAMGLWMLVRPLV
ncbi:glutaredoxin family protein [Alloyangia pacifica]|uniref:Methylamine utilization protein MauE n=1 Tax=Alloyangia pacifica TaxID=311180 RepID=A0A1I6UBF3_9RHOB|nr:glutaredoxin family protein [Alloyangia pacifica]SDH45926.1 Glutaredoxin [Alloyangia pacifica]SFS98839.1 Glutaredoxin [Alloyangia pacifica]